MPKRRVVRADLAPLVGRTSAVRQPAEAAGERLLRLVELVQVLDAAILGDQLDHAVVEDVRVDAMVAGVAAMLATVEFPSSSRSLSG
jgi:hypothetical protein